MQGIGQVFCEHIVWIPTGQLLIGTFVEGAMPRANIAAPTKLIDCGVLSPANSLGAKGAGEAGATGSVPALANAVLDALKAVNVQISKCPIHRHAFGRQFIGQIGPFADEVMDQGTALLRQGDRPATLAVRKPHITGNYENPYPCHSPCR